MSEIKVRQVVSYMAMPGYVPRLKALFGRGFGHVAFLMAHIYAMVRLLPNGHPYLEARNIGAFGIRQAVAAAANNLEFSRKNIDQIVIFFALLAGIVLLFGQMALLIMSFVSNPAAAQAFTSMFDTPDPTKDIAFSILDRVFGVPDFFCSARGICSEVQGDLPYPIHTALQSMFRFYSMALLVVGTLIVLYFIVVVVVETATSGTPFGQRFQNMWVPIRLVVAIGLLLPLNYGYNTGQYLAFFAAKAGSGFATNGWRIFNDSITKSMGTDANPIAEKPSLVGIPSAQNAAPLIETMSIVHSCAYAYWMQYKKKERGPQDPKPPSSGFDMVKPYFVRGPLASITSGDSTSFQEVKAGTSYIDALKFYNYGDVVIRFGSADENKSDQIIPYCGEVLFKVTTLKSIDKAEEVGGPAYMFKFYYELVLSMWFDDKEFQDFAGRISERTAGSGDDACKVAPGNKKLPSTSGKGPNRPCYREDPGSEWTQNRVDFYQIEINRAIITAWQKYAQYGSDVSIKDEVIARGWAGAGIWYNRIADLNGAFISASLELPYFNKYPKIMEEVRKIKKTNNANMTYLSQFEPENAGSTLTLEGGSRARGIASILSKVYILWNKKGKDQSTQSKVVTNNYMQDILNLILGTNGLFDIRGKNAHVHPLAQLAMVGKGLVEAAVRNILGATGTSLLGGLGQVLNKQFAASMTAASKFAQGAAFLGITAGVTLFYILPFLPFVYFFFAVSSWIRTIFEAMVGIPLWALAHLRIDGEGLPGQAAESGYFLIFEIFLRPILTVFALIAAILIFSAQVRVLNFIWDIVTTNVTGFSAGDDNQLDFYFKRFQRSTIDQFFFTATYTIIVYLMANLSFKLIDKIPDGILRWMGSSASAFGDTDQDPSESLTKYAAQGGLVQGQQLVRGVSGNVGELGQTLGQVLK